MNEESKNQLEEQSWIVADFGDFLTKHPVGGKILDVKALPHNKDTILDAVCFLIVVSEDEKRVDICWLSRKPPFIHMYHLQ